MLLKVMFWEVLFLLLLTSVFPGSAVAVSPKVEPFLAASASGPGVRQVEVKPPPVGNQVIAAKNQGKPEVAVKASSPVGTALTANPKMAPSPTSGAEGVVGKLRPKVSFRRCEPQSLTYARQRSGIMSCRNGRENGPMTWFVAEYKSGHTSDEPAAGSVLILKGQGHGMPTGHVAYVEEVVAESPTTYRLIFSHTNYDRQCHLETNIDALYDRTAMSLEVRSGAWRSWGRGLKVAGFIHRGDAVVAGSSAPETGPGLAH